MSKSIVPIHDKITVRKFNPEEQTKGGLYLPQKYQEGTYAGVVVHVGPGRYATNGDWIPMQVKVGDIVHFTRIAGVMHVIEDQELVVMKEEDASVIVRGTNE